MSGRGFAAEGSARPATGRHIVFPPRLDVEPVAGRTAAVWTAVHVVEAADPADANDDARAGVAAGADGLCLGFGWPTFPREREAEGAEETLATLLDGIDPLAVAIRLDPQTATTADARALAGLIRRRGIAPERVAAAFGLSPVLDVDDASAMADVADAAAQLIRAGFRCEVASLDARPLAIDRGADHLPDDAAAAGELASNLAAALWWIEALEARGVAPPEAIARMGTSLFVTQRHIDTIARLRALRLLWSRLAEILGYPGAPLAVHAEIAPILAEGDPHHSLVRSTIASFAAVVGEADSLAIRAPAGFDRAEGRRSALNIHHLLREEAGLGAAADAAAGSGAIEAATDRLAEAAWGQLGRIQSAGGLTACSRPGTPLAVLLSDGSAA